MRENSICRFQRLFRHACMLIRTRIRERMRVLQEDAISFTSNEALFKGIVSQDWGGLLKILLGRLEVFNISASHFFFFLSVFSYSNFKNGRLSSASFQHNSSKDQYKSGTLTVLRNSKFPGIHSCASLLSARRYVCQIFSALARQTCS